MASIQGIYVALFGRPADPAGLAYFNDETQSGADLTVIGDLAGTDEFKARFAGMEPSEIVNSIYQSLFERDAIDTDLGYWLEEWEAGRVNINDIAIRILDGAKDEDLLTVNLKIAAADLFTSHLDLDIEKTAYNGRFAESVGRDYIDAVTSSAATGAQADTAILRLFPDQGQAPGGGSGGGTPGGSPFSVDVVSGVLTFSGAASGEVTVGVENGQLVFHREGYTATLADSETIRSIQDNVAVRALDANSDVLAKGTEGWYFAQGGDLFGYPADALDFYGNPITGAEGALGDASNILLLSGFNVADFTDANVPWTDLLQSLIGGMGSASIADIAHVIDQVAHFLSSDVDVAIAAVKTEAGAFTSLNPIIADIITDISGGEGSLPEGFPNIGMPVLLEGQATSLSADGDGGFILVGNVEYLRAAATDALNSNWMGAYEHLSDGTSDTVSGGDGNDIIIGLGDQGSFSFDPGLMSLLVESEDTDWPVPSVTVESVGDVLAGGKGADVFVHIELANVGALIGTSTEGFGYSDGFDVITDFEMGQDTILLVLQGTWFEQTGVDTNGDNEVDSTLITFYQTGEAQVYGVQVDDSAETSGLLLKGYVGDLASETLLGGHGNGAVALVGVEYNPA